MAQNVIPLGGAPEEDGPRAGLPVNYEAARAALAECQALDECKGWADKAAALASYARQAKDETLVNMAMRIKARAIRRMGELLESIEPRRGVNQNFGGSAATKVFTRSEAAREAGLSKDQQNRAMRVARVPQDQFEACVERDKPATVTEIMHRVLERKYARMRHGAAPEADRPKPAPMPAPIAEAMSATFPKLVDDLDRNTLCHSICLTDAPELLAEARQAVRALPEDQKNTLRVAAASLALLVKEMDDA